MYLTEREKDKLLVTMAADVARRRLARGVRLNVPEAIALITSELLEGARDGRSVAELMRLGAQVLTREQVMDGVADIVREVQVEATFPDGTKLVTVHDPIRASGGAGTAGEAGGQCLAGAAGGGAAGAASAEDPPVPGEVRAAAGEIEFVPGRRTVELTVVNTGDRPVQVGSHAHFFEVNRALRFDRLQAYGMRLHIASGTAVRFEPGEEKRVTLVAIGGRQRVYGMNGIASGAAVAGEPLPDDVAGRLQAWEGMEP